MFSGIIEELGSVAGISARGGNTLFTIEAEKVLQETKTGDSIAVNGVCLTVVAIRAPRISFEVLAHTRQTTNLGFLRIGEKVNLERSLKVGDRISGHFVSGHVDCVGLIRRKFFRAANPCFEIALPTGLMKYCLPKGSIAVDGISLTIADKKSDAFSIYVIPHTLKNTTLGFKGPSYGVNIEFDILTKKDKS